MTNYSGSDATALLANGDGDAQLIVGGLSEDDEGAADMYVWDFRTSGSVPASGTRVWLYAVLTDLSANVRIGRFDEDYACAPHLP